MSGEHAAQNAAAAIVALEALIDKALDPDVAREALSLVRLAGTDGDRWVPPHDSTRRRAHPAGAEALDGCAPRGVHLGSLHVVTSILLNKDIPVFVRPLAALPISLMSQRTLTNVPRDPLLIAEEFAVMDEPGSPRFGRGGARGGARGADETYLIVVTGSDHTSRTRTARWGSPSRSWPIESTLLIVKPDGVRRGLVGEVLRWVAAKGLAIDAMRLFTIDRVLPRALRWSRDKPFFGELVDFITGGPVASAKVSGGVGDHVWRTLMGPTNPIQAPPGSIRGDFATLIGENIVHMQ